MEYTLEVCLPKVYLDKSGGQCNLHWDVDISYEACLIIDEQRDYIEGFLDGCYKLLSLNYALPTRVWGHSSGSVQGIDTDTAEALEHVIKELLHGLVRARYKNLAAKAS